MIRCAPLLLLLVVLTDPLRADDQVTLNFTGIPTQVHAKDTLTFTVTSPTSPLTAAQLDKLELRKSAGGAVFESPTAFTLENGVATVTTVARAYGNATFRVFKKSPVFTPVPDPNNSVSNPVQIAVVPTVTLSVPNQTVLTGAQTIASF